jgi:cardiolipin synthase
MLIARRVADSLTMLRGGMAFVLAGIGLLAGREALPLAAWLLLLAWTGDLLDGPIARRGQPFESSWWGIHDLEIDMTVAAGVLAYLVASGWVDGRLAAVYLVAWALIFWRWGLARSLGMLSQAPVYLGFLIVSVRWAPATGWWLVGWILAVVVITWPRFPKEVIPGFLEGMRALRRPPGHSH